MGVGATQTQAGDIDDLGCACVLIHKGPHCGCYRQDVAGDLAGKRCSGRGQHSRGLGVVFFTCRGDSGHRADIGLSDVSCGRPGGLGQRVVLRIGSTQAQAGDVHCFAHTCVLVSKGAHRRCYRQNIAADLAGKGCIGGVQHCSGLGIVRLACGGDTGHCADACFGDVSRSSGRILCQCVVLCIGSIQAQADDVHGLACARVLVGKGANRGFHRQNVTADLTGKGRVSCVQHGTCLGVVFLTGRRDSGHRADGGFGDVSRCGG